MKCYILYFGIKRETQHLLHLPVDSNKPLIHFPQMFFSLGTMQALF